MSRLNIIVKRDFLLSDIASSYLDSINNGEDDILIRLRNETKEKFGEQMLSSPLQGQLLSIMTQFGRVHNALEIGTFTGYSALWIARSLPKDGKLLCLEKNNNTIDIAPQYWTEANVQDKIKVELGDALENIESIANQSQYKDFYDFIFIDADKNNYPKYYEYALKITRPEGLIILDNTLWKGKVFSENEKDNDKRARVLDKLNNYIASDTRVKQILLPIEDGMTIVQKI